MKLTVSAKPFTADLKAVLPAVANRSGLPILSGVRLEASDDGLVIEATDLELTARASGPRGRYGRRSRLGRRSGQGSGQGRRGDGRTRDRAGVRTERRPGRPRCAGRHPNGDPAGLGDRRLAGRPAGGSDRPDRLDRRLGGCRRVRASGPVRVGRRFAAGPHERRAVLREGSALRRGCRDRLVPTGVARIPLASRGPRLREPSAGPGARRSGLLAKQLKGNRGAVQIRAREASGESHRAHRASRSASPTPSGRSEPSRGSSRTGGRSCRSPEGGLFEFDPRRARVGSASRLVGPHHTKGAPVRLTLDRTCSLAVKEHDLGEMREALTEASSRPTGRERWRSRSTPTTSPTPSGSAASSAAGCGCGTASSRPVRLSGPALRADADPDSPERRVTRRTEAPGAACTFHGLLRELRLSWLERAPHARDVAW